MRSVYSKSRKFLLQGMSDDSARCTAVVQRVYVLLPLELVLVLILGVSSTTTISTLCPLLQNMRAKKLDQRSAKL